MSLEKEQLQRIIEGALLAAGQPLSLKKLASLFESDEQQAETKKFNGSSQGKSDNNSDSAEDEVKNDLADGAEQGETDTLPVTNDDLRAALAVIAESCDGRGFELKELGSGWRFQVRQEMAPWVNRLWDEKPQKYSRALLETLALIAYRQPITRGDIEQIRGVAVSSHIIRTLVEREWVKVVGHRDVPGRPSLYASTRQFLDYFNLNSLDELPTLGELRDLEALGAALEPELALGMGRDTSVREQVPATPLSEGEHEVGSECERQDSDSSAAINEEGCEERADEKSGEDKGETEKEDDDSHSQESLSVTENALFDEVLADDSLFTPVAASSLFNDDKALENDEVESKKTENSAVESSEALSGNETDPKNEAMSDGEVTSESEAMPDEYLNTVVDAVVDSTSELDANTEADLGADIKENNVN